MAQKATQTEKDQRVQDVYRMLVLSWPSHEIVDYARQNWGLERAMAYRYIKVARQMLRGYLKTKRNDWVAQKLTTLEQMTRDELLEEGASTRNRLAAHTYIRTQAEFLEVL